MAKKKGKKKKKKAAKEPEPTGPTPVELLSNYKRACKIIGSKPDDVLVKAINDANGPDSKFNKLAIGNRPLGPAGVRALADAILGLGTNMGGQTFTMLIAIRLWRVRASDDGVIALADLLRLGGKSLVLSTLELVDNQIGPRGAKALGAALSFGGYSTLTKLNLEYNITLGSEGCDALCVGLRNNSSLKELYLGHCGIGPGGGQPLSLLLSYPGSALSKLDLKGNNLTSEGLKWLIISLKRNHALTDLNLFDNNIGGFPPSKEEVDVFRGLGDALAVNKTLTNLNMDLNYFGAEGSAAMKAGVKKNKSLRNFAVDYTLIGRQFSAISVCKKAAGSKKKGGKKKKKKKK